MTHIGDEVRREDRIVLVFDIRSSSNIIEDLNHRDMTPYRDMMIALKEWLREVSARFSFEPYKFTGDGWILLFSKDKLAANMIEFLELLYRFYLDRFHFILERRLDSTPKEAGLTVGIDDGSLVRFEMLSIQEYVGRALNVACRLQNAAKKFAAKKECDCTILVSNSTYTQCMETSIPSAEQKTVNLRNIRAGRSFQCRLHGIPPFLSAASSAIVAPASMTGPQLSPNGIQGLWLNTWRIDENELSERIEFTQDSRALVDGEHKFNIENVQVDEKAKKLIFTKIRVGQSRQTLLNELVIVDKETLAGIEKDPNQPDLAIGIRYKRTK